MSDGFERTSDTSIGRRFVLPQDLLNKPVSRVLGRSPAPSDREIDGGHDAVSGELRRVYLSAYDSTDTGFHSNSE